MTTPNQQRISAGALQGIGTGAISARTRGPAITPGWVSFPANWPAPSGSGAGRLFGES